MLIELDDDQKAAVQDIIKNLEQGDNTHREQQVKKWKEREYFWHGLQTLFWNDVSREWVTPQGYLYRNYDESLDEDMLDRIINIYRAHGESIIAALTVGVPGVKFFPDDADSPYDLATSKSASKIAQLIQSQNNAELLMIRALFLMFNQGMVFSRVYSDEDPKYGVIERYRNTGMAQHMMDMGGGNVIPIDLPVQEKYEEPKSQVRIELYGPLHVKIPSYIRTLSQAGYLIFEFDQHYALARQIFPELWDKISPRAYDVDRWLRSGSKIDEFNPDLVTVREVWIRPWTFHAAPDQSIANDLEQMFPDGACFTYIGDELAESYSEKMEDEWVCSEDALTEKIHRDPIGDPLINIQKIQNDVTRVTLEQFEAGVPENFIDPDVVDFDEYEKAPKRVGITFPAKALGGKALGDSFFQFRPASVSDELNLFDQKLEQKAQFAGGAFPSIFGGRLASGGETTAHEYETSKNQALQRLGLPFKTVKYWWAKTNELAVRKYIETAQGDERFVKEVGGSTVNVWIREDELKGKLGRVEPEVSDQFPLTWPQRRGMLMEVLMQLPPEHPVVTGLLGPENVSSVARTLGMADIKIPGEEMRELELATIAELSKSEPIDDPQSGAPLPSIQVDPDLDDHVLCMEVCRIYLVSTVGQELKAKNPAAYGNVYLHFMQHKELATPPAPPGDLQEEDTGEEMMPEEI